MAGHVTSYAWGYGGQFIVLVPDLELVVVTTSSSLSSDARRPHLRQLFDLFEFLVVAPLSDRENSSTVFRLP
jgi:CubicO group peptidase (beta-lactamase class C family)